MLMDEQYVEAFSISGTCHDRGYKLAYMKANVDMLGVTLSNCDDNSANIKQLFLCMIQPYFNFLLDLLN